MKLAAAVFPTDETLAPQEVARLCEERGFESLWFPSTPTSRPPRDALPGGRRLPSSTGAAGPVRGPDGGGRWRRRSCGSDRHLPGRGARSDHHRQGGRVARPALRRPRRVRRRRGLEPRGDAQPRHRPAPAMAVMRERVVAMKAIWTQDEASFPASTSTSTGSGRGPSRCRTLTRRSGSAATGRPSRTGCSRFGDGWMPNVVDDDELLARFAALRGRADREIRLAINASPRRPERLERYAQAGVERAIFPAQRGARRDRAARGCDPRLVAPAHRRGLSRTTSGSGRRPCWPAPCGRCRPCACRRRPAGTGRP